MSDAALAAPHKPGLLTRIAYGVGGAAGGIKNNGFEYVLLLFYSQVLGLPAVLVVLAMGIALVLDAISDPVVGYWSDNWRSKYGRRHPFMYATLVPVAIAPQPDGRWVVIVRDGDGGISWSIFNAEGEIVPASQIETTWVIWALVTSPEGIYTR